MKESTLNKVSFKGVIIGSITDIVSSNILAVSLIIYVTFTRQLAAIPKDQIPNALQQILQNDPILFSIQFSVGAMCSVLGGYVAARIARKFELLNGALASFLCVGIGMYALISGAMSVPLWRQLLGFVVSPALATLGGYLRLRTMADKSPLGFSGRETRTMKRGYWRAIFCGVIAHYVTLFGLTLLLWLLRPFVWAAIYGVPYVASKGSIDPNSSEWAIFQIIGFISWLVGGLAVQRWTPPGSYRGLATLIAVSFVLVLLSPIPESANTIQRMIFLVEVPLGLLCGAAIQIYINYKLRISTPPPSNEAEMA